MDDDAMELIGRKTGDIRRRVTEPVRTVGVASRVVQRREAILRVLDDAYRRDLGAGGDIGL